MTISLIDRPCDALLFGRRVLAGRADVPVGNPLIAAQVALRADVVEDRVVAVRVLHEVDLIGPALLALLRFPADVLPAEHAGRATTTGGHKLAGPRKVFENRCRRAGVFLRFSRFRFKEGRETEGTSILRRHTKAIRSAPGCRDAWLGQGQHPATEFVVVALFEDEDSLRRLEGRLRSDPVGGGDFFALLSMTTQPPEVTQYEVRELIGAT